MARYQYYSPPPPPCNNTTPILPPPPPPPPCNHTTSPTLTPPPPPTPACTCNPTTPSLPPPTLPSPPPPPPLASFSPPPPPPSSSHYLSPLASFSPPPPPSSPVHSPSPPPPPPSYIPSPQPMPSPPSSDYPPLSPPKPSNTQASPPPVSLPPNFNGPIAPGPSLPSGGQNGHIIAAAVSVSGVFFVAFVAIGLLSLAMKKNMLRRLPGLSNFMGPGADDTFKSTGRLNMDGPDLESSNMPPTDQPGQGLDQTSPKKMGAHPNVDNQGLEDSSTKPPGEPSDEKLDKGKHPLDQESKPGGEEEPKAGGEEEEETNDPKKKKLRVPKYKKDAKKGKGKHPGMRQVLLNIGCRQVVNTTGCCFDLHEPDDESENGDKDEEKDKGHDKDSKDEGSDPVKEESTECSHKPLNDQSEADNTDATQKVDKAGAAKEDSIESKGKLRPRNKGKASSSSGHPQQKKQLLNAYTGMASGQGDDDDEAEEPESDSQHDGGKMKIGRSTSTNVDEGVGTRYDTHEKESDERPCEPIIDQSEPDYREASQYVKKEPDEGEENSHESKKKSRLRNPSSRRMRKQKPSFSQASDVAGNVDPDGAGTYQEDDDVRAEAHELEPQEGDGELNLGGPNNANQDVEFPSNHVDDETPDERHRNPLSNKSESDDIDVSQDVGKYDAGKRMFIDSKHTSSIKKTHSSRVTGKQKAPIFGQVLNAASGVVQDEAGRYQDDDADKVQANESEPRNQYEEQELDGSEKDMPGDNDSSRSMVSLNDEEGEVKVPDLFTSAPGSKQTQSKVMALDGPDHKDSKTKVHLKSSGPKKNLGGPRHNTQVGEANKPFRFETIVDVASENYSGKVWDSVVDEDNSVQESESFASNEDSNFPQMGVAARGIEQSPNQNFTATSIDEPVEELKSRGNKGKQAKVPVLNKDSRKVKGGGRRIEPLTLDQTVTARVGDDLALDKGVEFFGGNQEGKLGKDGSNKDVPWSGQTSRGPQELLGLDQTFTATNEDDPNPEAEFGEDDEGLESENLDEDLSQPEPSPGEIEPSTDDQGEFVTDDNDPEELQFPNNIEPEEPADLKKDAHSGRSLSRRTSSQAGRRRDQSEFVTVDNVPDVLQFHNNEHKEPAGSKKDARPGKPLSHPYKSYGGRRRAC